MEVFIGSIILFAGNFAPNGFAFCDGQLLSIAQNSALFAILGTYFGGNGTTNFALPDLRGRVPLHVGGGPGPGLSTYTLGQIGGTEQVTLVGGQIPAHVHTFTPPCDASSQDATLADPTGAFPCANNTSTNIYSSTSSNVMGAGTTAPAGSNLPHANIQPFTAINYCIALVGIFPSRG